ncbi:thioredoxin domain-containing protein [Agrobacterium rubi]|nr:thioredoxin domain-containing protein [Agrobacterium rubi]NTF24361.1 thioredoxin domain-containing protein [Agrobacterium rubi]
MKRISTLIALLIANTAVAVLPANALSSATSQVAQESSSSSTTEAATFVPAPWDEKATYPTDIVVGAADAPVTIVEYGSLTCPHCAAFQNDKFPEMKKEWIDTGKVKLVFRHFPIDMTAMGAAVLVSCLPAQDRHKAVEGLYKDVNSWATKPLKDSIPQSFSKSLGRDLSFEKDFNACIQSTEFQQDVLRPAFDANKQGVTGTPTFFVGGEKVIGYSTADPRQIDNIIVRKLGEMKK